MMLPEVVLADEDRALLLDRVASFRHAFSSERSMIDSDGLLWAYAEFGDQIVAISALAEGWHFDPFARLHWADEYSRYVESRQNLQRTANAHIG